MSCRVLALAGSVVRILLGRSNCATKSAKGDRKQMITTWALAVITIVILAPEVVIQLKLAKGKKGDKNDK